MSHIPGPWKVEVGTIGGATIKADKCIVATVHVWSANPRIGGELDDTCRSNALLIAAAPDMLAALEGALTKISPFNDGPEAEAIRSAIAKAKP